MRRSERDAVPAGDPRGPRLRVVPGRRRRRRGRGGRRPAVGHRAIPPPFPLARGSNRARARNPQPRRPRLGPRPARPRHRGDDPHPPPRRRRVPARGVRRRLARCASARSRSRPCTPPATGPSTPRSCFATSAAGDEPVAVLTGDSLFVGDVARPDLAIEPDGGRARALPLAARAPASRCRRASRSGPGHLGGSHVRQLRDSTTGPRRRSASRLGHNHAIDVRRPPTSSSPTRSRPSVTGRRTSSTSSTSTAARSSRSSARRRR